MKFLSAILMILWGMKAMAVQICSFDNEKFKGKFYWSLEAQHGILEIITKDSTDLMMTVTGEQIGFPNLVSDSSYFIKNKTGTRGGYVLELLKEDGTGPDTISFEQKITYPHLCPRCGVDYDNIQAPKYQYFIEIDQIKLQCL